MQDVKLRQLANNGINVRLYEMRPAKMTPAHRTDKLAELVCSNSLKSDRLDNASGLLKEEMKAEFTYHRSC